MRKIKIFSGERTSEVEREVNEWLVSHKSAIIHNTLQTECVIDGTAWLTITIFYYEGEQGQ